MSVDQHVTLDDVKRHLAAGGVIYWHVFTFIGTWMNCSDGCCESDFETIDEMAEHIEDLTKMQRDGIDDLRMDKI